MDDDVLIRPYDESDLSRVRGIFIAWNRHIAKAREDVFEAYIARALKEEIERIEDYYLARDGFGFWVATLNNGVAGMVGVEAAATESDEPAGEVRRMYVDAPFRGRGLGRLLLSHAEGFCKEYGYAGVILSTSELQPQAKSLYENSGYRLVREEVAEAQTTRAAGGGLRRFHYEKPL